MTPFDRLLHIRVLY